MKSDSKSQFDTPGASAVDAVADPFAVDLFAGSRTFGALPAMDSPLATAGSPDALPSPHAITPESLWQAALPKVSVNEARLSAALAIVPPSLSAQAREALAHIVARYARLMIEDVTLDLVSLHEVSLAGTVAEPAAEASAPRVSLTFMIEPERVPAALSLDASFAAAMVDRLLGGDGAMPDALRPLSVTEQAVFEFLCLSVIRELNRLTGEPLFRLETCASRPPTRLLQQPEKTMLARSVVAARESKDSAPEARGIEIMLRVGLGENHGLVSLLLSDAALAALSMMENPLLARRESQGEELGARLARFKEFAPDVALRLLLGETQLDAHELAGLEAGDVVIIERPLIDWSGGRWAGFLRVGVGDGDGPLLTGNIVAKNLHAKKSFKKDDSRRQEETETLALKVEAISGGDGRRAEAGRINLEDERSFAADAEGGAALGGLLLTVHIELAACRISLDELSRLRAGQIIELGCRPTDPVHLVTEGRRVATGELIDIEGRLGVRVKHLVG